MAIAQFVSSRSFKLVEAYRLERRRDRLAVATTGNKSTAMLRP